MTLSEILEAALFGRLEPYHTMQLAAFVPKVFTVYGLEADPLEGWAVLHLTPENHRLLDRGRDTLDINDGTIHRAFVTFSYKNEPIAVYLYSR